MKPVVDGSPWPWSDDGSPIDFFGESQRPFRANAWKRRREEVEKSAAAGGAPPKKFSKLFAFKCPLRRVPGSPPQDRPLAQ